MSYQSARNEMEKGHASCSAEAVLSPIANQWGWCQIWHMSICQMALKKKKRRNQGLQKEQRQGIMCGEIEILGMGVHCVSSWVYSSSWAAWGNMEEIKAWQNIAKMGLEEERKWQVNRVSRLTENVSNQVHFFFFFVFRTECLEDARYRAGCCAVAWGKSRERWTETFCAYLVWEKPSACVSDWKWISVGKDFSQCRIRENKISYPFSLKSTEKALRARKGVFIKNVKNS